MQQVQTVRRLSDDHSGRYGVPGGRELPRKLGLDGNFYLSWVQVPRNGRADYEFPPAGEYARDAGIGVCRTRTRAARV